MIQLFHIRKTGVILCLSNSNFKKQFRGVFKSILFVFIFTCLLPVYSQTPTTGPWAPSNQTTTQHDVGVGTTTPRGKQEIVFCPQASPQDGLIVTAKDCNGNPFTIGGGGGLWEASINDPNILPVMPLLSLAPYVQILPSSFSSSLTKKNLFWVRTEDIGGGGGPTSIGAYHLKTHFIVNNEGRVGVNIMNPRAQFDVVQATPGILNNVPTAIFSKRNFGVPSVPIGVGGGLMADAYRTSQMLFFNRLGAFAYNNIIQTGDQAIIYSDGGNTDGSNVNGTFVIAPWGTSGGLRMEANGNTELRGNLRTTNVVVDARWWPDFVFQSNYKLMPLSEVAKFINTKHHLPGMPSQDSVMNSGQDVGELQKLQQQKIEELTLYTIQQDEQLKAQEARLKELEAKLNAILNK
ncbi:MAG: hypothetical protein Q8K70_04910 [Bacteroidota bacterium]|nr:hypothetical protein [Bacteroidota bacterium]